MNNMFHRDISSLANNSSEQRQRNENDNKWHGDEIQTVRDPQYTRLLFHNIRNLPLYGADGFEMFIQAQSQLQVDLQGFSEHCLDTTKFQLYQKARDILRTTYTSPATLQLNSSMEEATNRYKPGGTGILILGNLASRLEPQGKGGDHLGRWSFVHLHRHNLPPLTIISVYQVCPRPTNIIGNTAYHQQVRSLHKAGRFIHPRKAFMEDLQVFAHQLLTKDHDIILGGDFNEALQDKNSGLLKFATTNNLTDPFLHRFPHHEEFGTHVNGRRRIDVTLVTPRILASLRSIGYGPFDFATSSDHRPLFLEFDSKAMFGAATLKTKVAVQRGVKTKDKNSVKTFINVAFTEIHKKNGFHLQSLLDDDTATPQQVELIDDIVGTSELYAENKCHRRRPDFYSRTLVKQRLKVSLLHNHLRALKDNRDRYPQLRQKMLRTGVIFELPPTIQLTNDALKSARLSLQQTIKQSFEVRQEELHQDIQDATRENDKDRCKRLSSIKKAESGQRTYRVLKALRNESGNTQHLDRVEIPQSWPPMNSPVESIADLEDSKRCTEWRLVTAPPEVEYYLTLRNRLHFGQAEGSPFTLEPLSSDFDWTGTSLEVEKALKGEYRKNLTTPQCTELLAECKASATLDSIPQEITLAEFRGKIKSWRESTTTSPSGRHLGRYKALFTPLPADDSDNSTINASNLATKQEAIARLKLSLINYCIRNTYVLERWKTVVNLMIFKEQGDFQIHRLRVIHIYEADFNALLAIKWRRLLHFADSKDLIHPGQYGGRPGCEAQSLTLMEELKYDLSYLTRRTLFNFDNDATSCYDRILVPLASLINRKYGLDRKIVAVHAATLQQACFRLKTVAGISDTSYQHSPNFPIHGTGQGSGNSPSIWLFISSTLFTVHEAQAHGATFISPDGLTRVHISMVGFVDDSTGSCNDFQPSHQLPLPAMLQVMEKDAQVWNDLLYCSGGKLELPKCSFHVLHFEFKPNGKPVPSIDEYQESIKIQDAETRTAVPILSKRSYEPHKTLGHQKSPFVNTTRWGLQALQSKADRISILLATSPITRQGAQLAYHTIFVPSIKYTLPQSFFSKNSLDLAQQSSIRNILAKCGYNRNTARALIYAPTHYAGGGFLPWYILQGEGQVVQFLKHWRTQTVVSSTLRIAVYWAQWFSGHQRPIFEDVAYPLPYLECKWLQSLRNFLQFMNGAIHLDNPQVPIPERRSDIYIMNYARDSGLFDETDLSVINYCRLYLHVTTVSELFQPDGTTMIPALFHCQREPWFNPSTYIVLQPRPSDHHVRTKWQKLCRQWTTAQGNLAASMKLGPWCMTGDKLRRRRETYITIAKPKKIYHWRYGSYWEYRQSQQHNQVYLPVNASTWEPTARCIPVYAHIQTSGSIVINQYSKHYPKVATIGHSHNFEQYVTTLAKWEQHLLNNVEFHFGPYEILHQLSMVAEPTKIILVSDGSQRGNDLTFGWVCGNDKGTIYAENAGFGHGSPSSHRAEAWGMLSAMLFLHHLGRYTRSAILLDHQIVVEVYSDNAALIDRLTQRAKYSTSYPNATLRPDWEILEQIHSIAGEPNGRKTTFHWVKGHQDETAQELPVAAQFNIRADALAAGFTISIRDRSQFPNMLLPAERCRLIIDNQVISGQYIREIRRASTLPPFFEYLKQKHAWTDTVLNSIDWQAYTHAARNSKIHITQLLKLVHNKLPTRYEKAKADPKINQKCHYCEHPETFSHLMRCSNPVSQQFRHSLSRQLKVYFHTTGTTPKFQTTFLEAIETWLHDGVVNHPDRTDSETYESQKMIGWHLLLKGFFSLHWKQEFEQCQRSQAHSTSRSPTEYIAGIIRVLWMAQNQFWKDHLSTLDQQQAGTESPRSLDLKQDYSRRIRLLHDRKGECLHRHREIYFHHDIDKFLAEATTKQMREYLQQYEPAIQQSIKDAKRIPPARSIFSFPGFIRKPAAGRQTLSQFLTLVVRPPSTTPSLQAKRGGNFPHKHTRWKAVSHQLTSIRTFFTSKPSHT